MANLETLELTINGSATSASQGIGQLITSLSALSRAVGKNVNGLMRLNAELQKLKRISLPNIGKITGIESTVSKAKTTGKYEPKGMNVDAVNRGSPNAKPDTVWQKEYDENVKRMKAEHKARIERTKANRERIKQEAEFAKQQAEIRKQEALAMVSSASKTELLAKKLSAMKEEYANNVASGKLSAKQMADGALQIQRVKEQLDKLGEQSSETKRETSGFGAMFGKLKQGFSGLTQGVSKFFGRIKKIATTMLIRAALRGLIKSIKEGINNLYEWSKLNKGEFAKSFDTLKNKAGELKNSIGAAISPVIQAAIPFINALATAAINAFNWVNQLLSLLTGKSSWTKATEGIHDYADEAKKAGGATKDWLAAFDELNVMNSEGGGGSGKAQVDYSDMFEEVSTFDEKIRELANFLKENAESIRDIMIATGAAILAWKVSGAFAETLPLLSKIAGLIGVGAAIAITLQADWLLTNEYLNTGNEGWLWASILTTAVGSTAAYALANKIVGGTVAKYVAGITLILSAGADIKANIDHTDVSAFSKESIFTSIKAALSAGTGVALIAVASGATVAGTLVAAGGAALLTFAVAIGLKLLTQSSAIKWGSLSLTEEQIDSYVNQKMFTSSAKVLIDKYEVFFTKRNTLMEMIQDELLNISTNYNLLKLGIDQEASKTNIAKAIGGEDGNSGLIAHVKELCQANIDEMKLTFSSITAYDGSGNIISADTLLSGIEGWNKVSEAFEKKGKELTELLVQSAKGELTPEMEEYTQQLYEEVMNMATTISKAKEFGEASAKFQTAALDAMSKNSFTGVINAFNDYSSKYESTIRQSLTDQIAGWYTLADLETDEKLKAKYKKIADDLAAGFEQTVETEMQEYTQPGRKMIAEWLKGLDYTVDMTSAEWSNLIDSMGGSLVAAVEDAVDTAIGDPVALDMAKLVGLTGWDLLESESKKSLIKALGGITNKNTLATLKKMLKVSATEIIDIANWNTLSQNEQKDFIIAISDAFGAEGIKAIKSKLPTVKAIDILQVTNWKKWESDQQLEFLTAIKDAYGSKEAIEAAKKCGINIVDLVDKGMASGNEDIKKTAQEWKKIIDDNVKPKNPQIKLELVKGAVEGIVTSIETTLGIFSPWVKPKEDKDTTKKTSQDIETGLGTYDPKVKAKEDKTATAAAVTGIASGLGTFNPWVSPQADIPTASGVRGAIAGTIGNFSPLVSAVEDSDASAAAKSAIAGAVSGITTTVGVSASLTNGSSLTSAIKNAIKGITVDIVQKVSGVLTTIGSVITKSDGGFVDFGQLFIAREAGPEMVGTIGGSTAVANNDQIVAGIANGVAAANAEQNALLRQQNALLTSILNKDSTIRLGASAALGRTVQQSLDMYGIATGGA